MCVCSMASDTALYAAALNEYVCVMTNDVRLDYLISSSLYVTIYLLCVIC